MMPNPTTDLYISEQNIIIISTCLFFYNLIAYFRVRLSDQEMGLAINFDGSSILQRN